MTDLQDSLPPGWECKIDVKSGRQYYMNHSTKSTTWDDPRSRGSPVHGSGEFIPLQYGSPDLRRNSVYPSHPSPIPAFQMPGMNSPKFIPLQEMRSMSPFSIRTVKVQDSSFMTLPDPEDVVRKIASMFPNVQESHIRLLMKKYKNKETVVISALQAERHSVVSSSLPEESVVKISSMFPTVSDTHIKLLLKKYHNREAVVISALQVEKHPIMTPGPFATPPPTRNSAAWQGTDSPVLKSASCANSTYTGSPRTGDTHRSSPRPHPSPKLKLRYMKSIFPEAEEMIILDVLSSNENNIQKTSEILKEMGFARREVSKAAQREIDAKVQEQKRKDSEVMRIPSPVPLPQKIKTKQEKESIKKNLQDTYKDIPEHVITMALDSVQYDENRANQILQIMVQEDEKMKENTEKKNQEKDETTVKMDQLMIPTSVTTSQSRQSLKSLLKEKPENNTVPFSRVVEENNMNNSGYKSANLCNTQGAKLELVKGANEKLLLEDYVKWQGPNPKLMAGSNKSLARGPNADLLSKKSYTPSGANPELRKGAKFGLAKGSIFSQFKCVVTGGSRGK